MAATSARGRVSIPFDKLSSTPDVVDAIPLKLAYNDTPPQSLYEQQSPHTYKNNNTTKVFNTTNYTRPTDLYTWWLTLVCIATALVLVFILAYYVLYSSAAEEEYYYDDRGPDYEYDAGY